MLEKVDLDRKMKRSEWRELKLPLQRRLYELQKAACEVELPVVVLLEGWDGAGKGSCIRLLTQRLDPRGFKVWPIRAARSFETTYPWLWRYWLRLPNRGEIAIFDRSWYSRVLVERVEKLVPEEAWRTGYRDILDLEQMLAEDGHVIVKYWLHIARDEQRRRFKRLARDPLESWRVTPEDRGQHRKYDEYQRAAEEMLARTESEWGHWTIVEATNEPYAHWKVLSTLSENLDEGLRRRGIHTDVVVAEATVHSVREGVGSASVPSVGAEAEGLPEADKAHQAATQEESGEVA